MLFFFSSGNDLGVAFEIPQNLKNQAFFASCVLKVSTDMTTQWWQRTYKTDAWLTPSSFLFYRMQS